MDYDLLLEGCCEMGCRLLAYGAEIHRVEDTVSRLTAAYGLSGEVFAIPNCLIVSFAGPNGRLYTRMRRAEGRTIDIEGIERLNDLSRRLCAAPPEDPGAILAQARQVCADLRHYPTWLLILGNMFGAACFALFFSGTLSDALGAALCGGVAGACSLLLGRLRSNFFINTLASGFLMVAAAFALRALGLPQNLGPVIGGAIMVLVPGLVFTNFMSDLLTGDIVAGLSTFVRAVLTAGAIALGTGSAVTLCQLLWPALEAGANQVISPAAPLSCLFAFLACCGFCLPYNVRGIGALLCALGGAMGWAVYLAVDFVSANPFLSSLCAAVVVAVYSESMARIRKCPATSYLVVSYFPLVPGFTIYQAMDYGIRGDTQLFLENFIRTFGIAGCIALGALLVSSAVRIIRHIRHMRRT